MTPEQLQSIAFRWIENFNNKDFEKFLALYDDEAQHYSPKLKLKSPETNGLIQGKSAMRTWWQDNFNMQPELQYILKSLTANGDRVFMEYTRQNDSEEDLLVAEVLEVRDNKIIFSRVYHG